MNDAVFAQLRRLRIVPVVEVQDAERAVDLARALSGAGLPAAEITLRTPAALDAIAAIADALPDFLVGAGTLLGPEQVHAAQEAGARFGVSPGFTPALSSAAASAGLPFIPGAVTASEILAASGAGHRHLKFFPAESSGGADAVSSYAGPFAGAGIAFMPTGGIRPETFSRYLSLPNVFAVGGTWIAPRDAITEGRFDEIRHSARAASALARSL
jgi:2-dehydro-3-deoxyphosphogluconate aldolase/(4S)-4-hydroxy-2-oxoglutarate aldolase